VPVSEGCARDPGGRLEIKPAGEAACRVCWLTHPFARAGAYGPSTSDRRGDAGVSTLTMAAGCARTTLTSENEWGGRGSNPRPTDYESVTVAFVALSCVGCSTTPLVKALALLVSLSCCRNYCGRTADGTRSS
jgi:hypothetical protein